MTDSIWKENIHIQELGRICRETGETIEGNLFCDISWNNWKINENIDKIRNLQHVARDKKKIMEIGVNACHSLLIMLLINSHADYTLFDLNYHRYTEPCLAYIRSQFPSTNIHVVFGDSCATLASFLESNPLEVGTFDMIHIDGGHSPPVFMNDFFYSMDFAHPQTIIIFDDTNYHDIQAFLRWMIHINIIQLAHEHILVETPLHMLFQYTENAFKRKLGE